jgi:hypothetical protein
MENKVCSEEELKFEYHLLKPETQANGCNIQVKEQGETKI